MGEKKTIIGVFDHFRFQSKDPGADIGFVIGILKLDDGTDFTIKGDVDPAEFMRGVRYKFQGYTYVHPKHGSGLHFKSWAAVAPHSREGLVKYLEKHCVGIGPKRASDLFDAFGAEAVAMVRNDPEACHKALKSSLKLELLRQNSELLKQKVKFEDTRIALGQILGGRGFPGSAIETCIAKWGLNAPEVIRNQPFTLMMEGIEGAGWKRCDAIYRAEGHDLSAIIRQVYAMQYALKSDTSGHTWFEWSEAVEKLNQEIHSARVDGTRALEESLEMNLVCTRIVEGKRWVSEAKKAANEATIAESARRLLTSRGAQNATESAGAPVAGTGAKIAVANSTTSQTKGAISSPTPQGGPR